jgi:hypothetical protein
VNQTKQAIASYLIGPEPRPIASHTIAGESAASEQLHALAIPHPDLLFVPKALSDVAVII